MTKLDRTLGVPGAVFLGMGSMVGTGVFVSVGLVAGAAGSAVLPAIAVAALVALCNGMSSAQLAAAHPVSGGTYEYGYRFLTPRHGFAAGWMFLCAKSASAATAALGFSGYLWRVCGLGAPAYPQLPALGILAGVTWLVGSGLRRTHAVNVVLVSVTLLTLGGFVVRAAPSVEWSRLSVEARDLAGPGFLRGCALMFVAFTGYGRVATLGEEIRDPTRSIPRAIVAVVGITALLYMGVAGVASGVAGPEELGEWTRRDAAPLESVLRAIGAAGAARVVAVGALVAMAGVLLNLVIGLSRVLLAMGRRGDMPAGFARVVEGHPRAAIVGVAVWIGVILLPGRVEVSWSFSAFTVLIYYGLTHLAALNLPPERRLYPRGFSMGGLAACLGLAFQVEPAAWGTGLAVLAAGMGWHELRRFGSSAVPRG